MEIARRSRLHVTRGARVDLLFTMSDNPCAPPKGKRTRICCARTSAIERGINPGWWSQTGSNRRPPACKAGALPTELWPQVGGRPPTLKLRRATFASKIGLPAEAAEQRRLVGLGRFELPTSRLSSARSNQLSYKPVPGVSNQ